jgi:tetratricopeptide (TPR) repeat protein
VLMEAARRADELERAAAAVSLLGGVYAARGDETQAAAGAADADEARLLGLLDGSRDVGALCLESGLGSYRTRVILASLIEACMVTPVDASEHLRLGERGRTRGDRRATTFHYRKALELRHNDTETRQKLADVLLEIGESDAALVELKQLAAVHRELRHDREAIDCYLRAVALAPRDLSLREQLYAALQSERRVSEAIREGEALASLAAELGLHGRSSEVLAELVATGPEDPERYQQRIADNLASAGRVMEAAAGYVGSARRLLAKGRSLEAERALARALSLEGDGAEAARLLEDLRSGRLERRRLAWRRARRLGSLAILAALLLCWLGYDQLARQELSRRLASCFRDVDAGDLGRAARKLEALRDRYPYTFAARHAAAQARALRELEAEGTEPSEPR